MMRFLSRRSILGALLLAPVAAKALKVDAAPVANSGATIGRLPHVSFSPARPIAAVQVRVTCGGGWGSGSDRVVVAAVRDILDEPLCNLSRCGIRQPEGEPAETGMTEGNDPQSLDGPTLNSPTRILNHADPVLRMQFSLNSRQQSCSGISKRHDGFFDCVCIHFDNGRCLPHLLDRNPGERPVASDGSRHA